MTINFEKTNFLLWRTPLLPFNTCFNLSAVTLKEKYSQELVKESLFLSSPDMYQLLIRYLEDESKEDKARQKIEITLAKYLLRMSYRCTPYGLFAGVSLGSIAESTKVELKAQSEYRRVSRLDMDFLCALSQDIVRKTAIRSELLYFPNNTIYLVGDQLRYVEYRIKIKQREHFLSKIRNSEYIQKVLKISQCGATPLQMAEELIDEDIDLEDALAFIYALIDNQVLLSQLEPAITGLQYGQQLLDQLTLVPNNEPISFILKEAQACLLEKDKNFTNHAVEAYWQIADDLKALGTPFEIGQLFQVDMMKPTFHSQLNQNVINQIQTGVRLLAGINDGSPEQRNLNEFTKAFFERYEYQEVPLVEVMDSEMGLGYPITTLYTDQSPLLEDLPIPQPGEIKSQPTLTEWDRFLMGKYIETVSNKKGQLNLEEAEISPFLKKENKIATSLFSVGYILASSSQAIDDGKYRIVHTGTRGPSSATLLGRFCHLDEQITQLVKESLKDEEETNPTAIFAEIVHINQARIGNICARPLLRKYEIPIITKPGVESEYTILLEDLVVSYQENRILLKSKRLNKEVIPRLSTAHNYTYQSLPVYQFLCDLQFQQLQGSLVWKWGNLAHADFLPRVTIGNLIVSEARWLLPHEVVSSLKELPLAELKQAIGKICQKRNIPFSIVIEEGDNQLPLNLTNELCLKVLQSLLKPGMGFLIKECLVNEENLWVEGPEGLYTHEFIIPLKTTAQLPAKNVIQPLPHIAIPRKFRLGSEWLYVKLYCGVVTADKLLTEAILPLTEELVETGIIDQWFFIRYQDPGNHLRIRFHGDGLFYQDVILKLNEALEPYLEANLISKILFDTYIREIERYNPINMPHTESLFHYDSIAVVQIVKRLDELGNDKIRWLIGLLGIDSLLNDCSFPLEKRKNLFKRLEVNFKEEFNSNNIDIKKAFAQKFRNHKQLIESALAENQTFESEWSPFIAIFKERSRQWQADLNAIVTNCHASSSEDLETLLMSYIHMFFNRLFRSRQRMHELVVYDFLYQYYLSKWMRTQKGLKSATFKS